MIDVTQWSDEDLEDVVKAAALRLGPNRVAELAQITMVDIWDRPQAEERVADYRQYVATYYEEAKEAGYLLSSAGKIHAWDCPTLKREVRVAEEMLEHENVVSHFMSGYRPNLPDPLTLDEARALLNKPRARPGVCRTCSPDV